MLFFLCWRDIDDMVAGMAAPYIGSLPGPSEAFETTFSLRRPSKVAESLRMFSGLSLAFDEKNVS
jgi:hypothetical protein